MDARFCLWSEFAVAVSVRGFDVRETEGDPKVRNASVGPRVIARIVYVRGLLVGVGPILLAFFIVVAEAAKNELARTRGKCAPLPLDLVLPGLVFA